MSEKIKTRKVLNLIKEASHRNLKKILSYRNLSTTIRNWIQPIGNLFQEFSMNGYSDSLGLFVSSSSSVTSLTASYTYIEVKN